MSGKYQIRPIEERDVDALYAMICALADHEGETHWLETTPERLKENGFGDRPRWTGFIAEHDGSPCGYATYTRDYHLWTGGDVLRLDDIYVAPDQRGSGLGESLMRKVFAEAEKTGAMVIWSVRTENTRAIDFYKKLGAEYNVTGKCFWRPGGA